ncbi:unnamed protein product [Triticum turgidum subsp. durum]|uniref:Uncharacterized protein n=1 Tax=Triticum turgidum subsp. durum TaxID=4567 RepID=A0A9R0XG19_TRITD|nr:unnamed protein product [Triticum turgidum subsp. durum]
MVARRSTSSMSTSGRNGGAPGRLSGQLDFLHGIVGALSSVRWKRRQTSGGEDPPPFRDSRAHEAAGGASTSRPQEIVPAE